MRLADQPAVGLELRFTGAAQADAAAALPLEVGPPADESSRHVLQLREFDLQLAFEGTRTLREDVEDQSAAVEHAALEFFFEIAFLARAQRVVDHHEVGLQRLDPWRAVPRPCRCRSGNGDPQPCGCR